MMHKVISDCFAKQHRLVFAVNDVHCCEQQNPRYSGQNLATALSLKVQPLSLLESFGMSSPRGNEGRMRNHTRRNSGQVCLSNLVAMCH
jgi:hypothetical protein